MGLTGDVAASVGKTLLAKAGEAGVKAGVGKFGSEALSDFADEGAGDLVKAAVDGIAHHAKSNHQANSLPSP